MSSKQDPKRAQDQAAKAPSRQTGEEQGKIKRPQQTDATMADKDLARGSEPATHIPSSKQG